MNRNKIIINVLLLLVVWMMALSFDFAFNVKLFESSLGFFFLVFVYEIAFFIIAGFFPNKQNYQNKKNNRKKGSSSGKGNPQRSTLRISVHRTQAVFLLLLFAAIGVLMGVCIWKAGSFIANYADRTSRYDKMIVAAGRRNGVYPPLLKAVIWKESRFDASARGSKGEIGLMQIMPQAAVRDWETTFQRQVPSDGALMDPALNIEIGSWFLGRALDRWKDYNEAEALALCEYNAGIQRAESWKPLLHDGKVMPNIDIESTRKYVQEILERREKYEHEWKWEKLK